MRPSFHYAVVIATALALSFTACSDEQGRPCGADIPQQEEMRDSIGLEISGPENPVKSTMLESVCVPVVISASSDTSDYDNLTVRLAFDESAAVTADFAGALPTPGSPLVGELRFDLTESPIGRSSVVGVIEMTGGSLMPKRGFILEIQRSGDEVEVTIVSGLGLFTF